jgi:GDP-L-fucose synthase
MNKNALIFVAGHRGLVGAAITRRLTALGYSNLLLRDRSQLDLLDQAAVDSFFAQNQPEYVFLAAAKVGGIHANDTHPAEFIKDNLVIQTNVIDGSYRHRVKKLLFLGSSCIYPKHAPQPMPESCLLTGPLEPTNEPYAIAKIAGIKMCEAYRRQYGFKAISIMPTNLYGPGDNFSLESSHVLPALIRKFHDARVAHKDSVAIWGSGTPRREFLFVDDLADAVVFLMEKYDQAEPINVGAGTDVTIRELAETIGRVVGLRAKLQFDSSKPDGTLRKLLDVSRLHAMGWAAETSLVEGIRRTYDWYLKNEQSVRH